MNKINNEINKIKIKEKYPISYAKLIHDKKYFDQGKIYGIIDDWFFGLGFDVIATPQFNKKTNEMIGYIPAIKLYETNIFKLKGEFINVSEKYYKRSETCYRKAIEKAFQLLENQLKISNKKS